MIVHQLLFFMLLFFVVFFIKLTKNITKSRFFEYVPIVVLVYFLMIIVGNLEIFSKAAIYELAKVKLYLLSSMIILMLLKSQIKEVYKLKAKLLGTFFAASASIMVAFIIMWFFLKNYFPSGSYKAFGALCGCWIGGMANMIAVSESIGADGATVGFCMISDTVNYSIWLAFLLFAVNFRDRFNLWSKAKQVDIYLSTHGKKSITSLDYFSVVFALLSPFLIIYVASYLPKSSFTNQTFWTVLLSTVVGAFGSLTRFSQNCISEKIGFEFLYVVIAITAVGSSFDDFSKAPLFIFAGMFVLIIHTFLMLLYAKVFNIDLFSISVSSLANIGGVASAPILAANYHPNLVGVGVIMAMLGYIIGTFCGLIVSFVLAVI